MKFSKNIDIMQGVHENDLGKVRTGVPDDTNMYCIVLCSNPKCKEPFLASTEP
jgi:hypothetical protein